MNGANALAYLSLASMTKKKSFLTSTPDYYKTFLRSLKKQARCVRSSLFGTFVSDEEKKGFITLTRDDIQNNDPIL